MSRTRRCLNGEIILSIRVLGIVALAAGAVLQWQGKEPKDLYALALMAVTAQATFLQRQQAPEPTPPPPAAPPAPET